MRVEIAGFDNITPVTKAGVYVLVRRGRVVYVGTAKNVAARIAKHAELARDGAPLWFPVKPVAYDEVHFSPTHPDRIPALIAHLIALYDPIYNRPGHVEPDHPCHAPADA